MIKSNNFIIPLVIYPFETMISIGEETTHLRKKILSKYYAEEEIEFIEYKSKNHSGRFVIFECGLYLIRVRAFKKLPEDYATIQHEITHIVLRVLDKVGMELEIGVSEEAYTYLSEYLTREIYKKLK